MNRRNAFRIYLYLENCMTNRALYRKKELSCFDIQLAGFFRCIDQPYKFLCGVSDGNIVLFPFRNLLLKIYTGCFVSVADMLGGIEQGKMQIARALIFHMKIRGFQLPRLIGGRRNTC